MRTSAGVRQGACRWPLGPTKTGDGDAGQIWLREKRSVSDLESSSLAGFFALIRSLLLYRVTSEELILVRTGSHSELFGR
jgi:hypothetical protein